MSKIAEYLQGHIHGEIVLDNKVREQYSRDESFISKTPDIVVQPRLTNDVRKVLRFFWQLAQKGHRVSLAARGSGSDKTGGCLTNGVVVAMSKHLNNIFEYDEKQRLVRVQSGVRVSVLKQFLRIYGSDLPTIDSDYSGTLGGALSNGYRGALYDKYGDFLNSVSQLEVVLANGDILQTSALSKKQLDQYKGRSGFEGEIYRQIDGLIEENQETIEKIRQNVEFDNSGYSGIAKVKDFKGNFDLTPLFAGAQGTLGIVTEMILKVDSTTDEYDSLVFLAKSIDSVMEITDMCEAKGAGILECVSEKYIRDAKKAGYNFEWYDDLLAKSENGNPEFLVVCGFEGEVKSRRKMLQKVKKLALKKDYLFHEVTKTASDNSELVKELPKIIDLVTKDENPHNVRIKALDGIYIPREMFNVFYGELLRLAQKLEIEVRLYGSCGSSVYGLGVSLPTVTTKNKENIFMLMDVVKILAKKHSGHIVAKTGEGVVMSRVVRGGWDDDVAELYDKIREIFDARQTLNTDVKKSTELSEIVKHIK